MRSKSRNGRRSKRKSKSKVRIPVTKGKLFGYHVDNPTKSRRSLLKRLISSKRATFSEVIKRLNALSIYNKNRHPEMSRKVRRDMEYIEKHMGKYRLSPYRSPIKRSLKRSPKRSLKRSPKKKSYKKKSSKRKSYKKKSKLW